MNMKTETGVMLLKTNDAKDFLKSHQKSGETYVTDSPSYTLLSDFQPPKL